MIGISMGSKETLFFAKIEELMAVMRGVTELHAIQIILAGNFDNSTPYTLEAHEELQAFQRYLIMRQGKGVNLRKIELRSGEIKYAIDQLYNQDSCIVHTGGVVKGGQLIAGKINTLGESKEAIVLYDMFAKPLRKAYVKIKSYYVSPSAELMLDSGKRLSQNQNAPVTYDLVR